MTTNDGMRHSSRVPIADVGLGRTRHLGLVAASGAAHESAVIVCNRMQLGARASGVPLSSLDFYSERPRPEEITYVNYIIERPTHALTVTPYRIVLGRD